MASVRLSEAGLDGLYRVDAPADEDGRGGLRRLHCADAFAAAGVRVAWEQTSVVTNRRRGTLRGLHYQLPPGEEDKLVFCLSGRIFDVAVDLRRDSPTFGRWAGFELDGRRGQGLFIPAGFAHGYVTLEDSCDLLYFISARYEPALARGVRWNDPTLAVVWPIEPVVVSERDAALPFWNEAFP